jgi:hypothetical protein
MGRALLMLCAAAWVAACGVDERPARQALGTGAAAEAARPDPHAALTCAACHQGELPGARRASVPSQTCAAAGCHQERGPSRVSTATASFPHRDHGADGDVALGCAGCHTHDTGDQPLRVSSDGCALCHLSDMAGGAPDDCRLCHTQPQHVAMTSQALPIPHSALPWVETGCVRCHYDVAEPQTRVELGRCTACHGTDATVLARGIATDLHPSHVSVTCTACHDRDVHHVRAMSSAVQLACADCHISEHGVRIGTEWRDDDTCTSCHELIHQPQQRLLLGMVDGAPPSPSSKFIAGMTCRSCHIRTARTASSTEAIRGQAEACASCHRSEYGQVLDWWLEGTRSRTRAVSQYVARARAELGAAAPDTARALIESAARMMALVEEAGGHHNLELSDRIFRESVARVRSAYGQAGRVPPQPPVLGSPAHEGVCSFCHYAADGLWNFERMSGAFHRAIISGER